MAEIIGEKIHCRIPGLDFCDPLDVYSKVQAIFVKYYTELIPPEDLDPLTIAVLMRLSETHHARGLYDRWLMAMDGQLGEEFAQMESRARVITGLFDECVVDGNFPTQAWVRLDPRKLAL